jgi:uncharacterized membrane protein
MFIQKILHVHRSLAETKTRLSNISTLRRYLSGVDKAVVTADGVGQFACVLPSGISAHCVLVGLPTEDDNQVLFQSTTGNVTVAGLIEFVQIRENLTEVQLTLEYTFSSVFAKLVDRCFKSVDRFFQRQFATLQMQLEGSYAYSFQSGLNSSRLQTLAH